VIDSGFLLDQRPSSDAARPDHAAGLRLALVMFAEAGWIWTR
jgi:hypothetical protein